MKGLETYSVIAVPFPFTDRSATKKRPALVISSPSGFGNLIGHSVMAMITSSKNSHWPLDVELKDLKSAGLSSASMVRMKLFTLDHRMVISVIGKLSRVDRMAIQDSLKKLFLTEGND